MIVAPASVAQPPRPLQDARPATSGSKAPALFGMGVIWLALVFVVFQVVTTGYEITMLISIGSALLTPLFVLYVRGELDIFEPLVFANAALASMFLGRPLYDIGNDNWWNTWFSVSFNVRNGFDSMLFYALLGIIALQVGYLSKLPRYLARKLPSFPSGIDTDATIKVALFIFLLGSLLFEEYVRQSGGIVFLAAYLTSRNLGAGLSYKTASGYLMIGPILWPPAGLLALLVWFRTRRTSHLLLAILALGFFFISMIGGVARSQEIAGILGLFVVVYIARRKRPSLLVMTLVALVALPYLVYERQARTLNTVAEKERAFSTILDHPGQQVETIWSQDDAAMADYFSYVVAAVPSQIPFGYGSTIRDIFIRAYPRFLAPNHQKPDERAVYVFKRLFPTITYRFSSGTAGSVIMDFYEDDGALAIILGMFTVGILLSIPKQWLQNTDASPPAQLLFVSMPAITIALMRGGIVTFVLNMVVAIIPILLIGRFARKRS